MYGRTILSSSSSTAASAAVIETMQHNEQCRESSLAPHSTSLEHELTAFYRQVGSSPAACAGLLTGDAVCQPASAGSAPSADHQQQPCAACCPPHEVQQPAAAAATTSPVSASPPTLGDTTTCNIQPLSACNQVNYSCVLMDISSTPASARGQPLRRQGFELQASMLRAHPHIA